MEILKVRRKLFRLHNINDVASLSETHRQPLVLLAVLNLSAVENVHFPHKFCRKMTAAMGVILTNNLVKEYAVLGESLMKRQRWLSERNSLFKQSFSLGILTHSTVTSLWLSSVVFDRHILSPLSSEW